MELPNEPATMGSGGFAMPTIKIEKMHEDAKLPSKGSIESAGLDLHSAIELTIEPGHQAAVNTGIKMAIPHSMFGHILPRSKLAVQHGLHVMAGVVDSDYRGEIIVVLRNFGRMPLTVKPGDRVAQMVVKQHFSWLPIEQVDSVDDTDRGAAGILDQDLRLS
jgi:dUTP pyrophosphatase